MNRRPNNGRIRPGAASPRRSGAAAQPEPAAPPGLVRTIGVVLTVRGVLGSGAAVALALDRFAGGPACRIGEILTCTPTTFSPDLLVLPDPVLGLISFPLVAAYGVTTLRGTPPPRWAWWLLQFGATGGLVLVASYAAVSITAGSVCLLCVLVWCLTIAVFWYAVVYNLSAGRTRDELAVADRFAVTHHRRLLLVGLLAPCALLVLVLPPTS